MGDITKIEWTTHTFNPWIGCTNVSPGCDHCYAEAMNAWRGWTEWGPHGERRRTSQSTWAKPLEWQRNATAFRKRTGHNQRVFCASLADVFDNKAPKEWRDDLWNLIRRTPDLDWQLLTKRPQNITKFLPADWNNGYPNVWLGITTEDQKHFDQRWPVISKIPAVIRFISYEPAIGPLRLPIGVSGRLPDWIICGGESGGGARVMDPQWARDLLADCRAELIPYFFKQWGTYKSNPMPDAANRDPHGKGGGLLDGRLYREFPNYQTLEKANDKTLFG